MHNSKLKEAAVKDKVFLGPTPMSEFVRYKAAEIRGEFAGLLSSGAETALDKFGHVWAHARGCASDARRLIVALELL